MGVWGPVDASEVKRTSRPLATALRVGLAPVPLIAAIAAGLLPVPIPPAAAAEAPSVSLTLAAGSGTVAPGQDLTVTATVANRGTTALQAGDLRVGLARDEADRGTLEQQLADPAAADTDRAGSTPVPALSPGASAALSVTVPAAEVARILGDSDWGAHLVAGTLEIGGDTVSTGASGVVWLNGTAPAPVGVALVMPLTTPGISEGLLDAQSLDAYTSVGGVLRKKLDAVQGTPAAIALDPRILASIRALGSTAPQSAIAWLGDLRESGNYIFPLGYADADPSLQRAAGAPGVLAPGSFESSLDPANFAEPAPVETPTASPGAAGTATPEPSDTPSPAPTPGALPTGDALLAWNYSATDIAWPTAALPGDLPYFAAAGLRRALVPSTSLADPASPVPAAGTIEGSAALIVDSSLSAAASSAAFSAGEAEGRGALADATALLAASADEAETGTTVVLALDRAWPAATANLPTALGALRALPWVAQVPLDQVQASGDALAVRGDQPGDPRAPASAQLVQDDGAIGSFATILERPDLLTGRERLRLLAVLSAQWRELPDAWQTAASDLHSRFTGILGSVSLASTSVFVVSPDAEVPISVRNDLDFPVTIRLDGRPSNGRILVEGATATVDAQSSQRVGLPTRSIVNGRVTLTVTAFSASGVQIGNPAVITLDVQAEWEAVGTSVVIGLVVALFGFGIYRNIRRRRRAAAEAAE